MSEQELITEILGFEFQPLELQTVNADDLLRLVAAVRANCQSQPVVAQTAGEVPKNDETGLEEWAAGKFGVGGAFRGELCGNTDWALARLVWSAALESQHTRIVSALQARAVVMPERAYEYWFLGDAGQPKGSRLCKKSSMDGALAFFESEADARSACKRHTGTEVYPVTYYAAPPASSVVLPERSNERGSDGELTYEAKAHNRCLDEVARLNGGQFYPLEWSRKHGIEEY